MKTTKKILFEMESLSENFFKNWKSKNDFWTYEKKEWFSKDEIKKAISKCYSYGHAKPLTEYYNNKDDNLICIAELEEHLFTPDLNSRSSNEDSLNKGYEVNQK